MQALWYGQRFCSLQAAARTGVITDTGTDVKNFSISFIKTLYKSALIFYVSKRVRPKENRETVSIADYTHASRPAVYALYTAWRA